MAKQTCTICGILPPVKGLVLCSVCLPLWKAWGKTQYAHKVKGMSLTQQAPAIKEREKVAKAEAKAKAKKDKADAIAKDTLRGEIALLKQAQRNAKNRDEWFEILLQPGMKARLVKMYTTEEEEDKALGPRKRLERKQARDWDEYWMLKEYDLALADEDRILKGQKCFEFAQ